jgi:hypothetical protein
LGLGLETAEWKCLQYGQNGIAHLDDGTLNRTFRRCLLYSNVETKAGRRLYGKSNRLLALSGRIISFTLLIMVAWAKSFYPSTNVKIDPWILE